MSAAGHKSDREVPREDIRLSADARNSSREFRAKSKALQRLTNEALDVLDAFGVPLEDTPRRIERMALAFLAVADVSRSPDWRRAKSLDDGRSVSTRQIIEYWNEHLGESVSSGSYDDVRRRDLEYLVHAGLVVPSRPDAARNAPHRGYALQPEFAVAVRRYGTPAWESAVTKAMTGKESLAEMLALERELARVPIRVAPGITLSFGPGEHNLLIRAVIEEFLTRFGHGAEVLYVGDAEKKDLHMDRDRLKELGFFDLDHGELPDVVAYSPAKDWLYIIEAVHSFGPISPIRHAKLRALLTHCDAGLVFVTAFADRPSFRKQVAKIAWETEVWIADEPDHLIHFDGERFLGPYAG